MVGWTAEVADAIAALEEHGAYRACGIADGSGAALVRARYESDLPCHQQVRRFIASSEYDAVLIAAPQPSSVVALAAARGAEILLLPGACDADTLEGAAEAARVHGVRLVVLRPEAHDSGLADLGRLLRTSDDWDPHYLDITVEGPAEVERLTGTAIAHAIRLAPDRHGLVRASAWYGGEALRAVSAEYESGGRQVHVHARHAPDTFIRIAGDSMAGAFELRIAGEDATLMYTTPSGGRCEYLLEPTDHWALEAARAASADDTGPAREEAGLLSAVTRAILTGEAQMTECCTRPALRIIEGIVEGQGHSEPARRRQLHLVVS